MKDKNFEDVYSACELDDDLFLESGHSEEETQTELSIEMGSLKSDGGLMQKYRQMEDDIYINSTTNIMLDEDDL